MTDTQDAVTALQRLGMKVQTLSGPQGFRIQITTQAGHEYQFSASELIHLKERGKLNAAGLKEFADEIENEETR